MAATIKVNEHVILKLRVVPREAKLLQHICETATEMLGLDPSACVYKGQSAAAVGEKLRVLLSRSG